MQPIARFAVHMHMLISATRAFHGPLYAVIVFFLAMSGRAETVLPEDAFPQLRQILADAAEQSPRMILKNLDRVVAEGDKTQARSGLYPSVNGFYQMSQAQDRREDQPGTLDTDKIFYSLTLNQPIFHWGERRNNAQIGEIRRQIADENYKEGYRLLAQEIRSAYLGLIMAKIQLANATYNRELALEARKNAEDRLAKGAMSEGEIFAVRIRAEQSQLDVENAALSFDAAKRGFALLTNTSMLSDDEIPATIPPIAPLGNRIDDLLSAFLGEKELNTAESRILRQQIVVEDLTYRNHQTRLRPKLNFVVGLSQDEQSYTANAGLKYGVRSQYVGLQMNWSIFDGFATRGAIRSSLARKRQAETHYRQYTETVRNEARQMAQAVGIASRQMAISERLLDNANGFLKFTKEDHARGNASVAQVNHAQANFNELEFSANSARLNYLMRVSEFMGRISQIPAPALPSLD